VKFADFQIITRSRTFAAPVPGREDFARIGLELLAAIFPLPKGVRLLGITLSQLVGEDDPEPQLRLSL
jgi:DNA polymerase-4